MEVLSPLQTFFFLSFHFPICKSNVVLGIKYRQCSAKYRILICMSNTFETLVSKTKPTHSTSETCEETFQNFKNRGSNSRYIHDTRRYHRLLDTAAKKPRQTLRRFVNRARSYRGPSFIPGTMPVERAVNSVARLR